MKDLTFVHVNIPTLPATDRVVQTSNGNYILIRMTSTQTDTDLDGVADQINLKTQSWGCNVAGIVTKTSKGLDLGAPANVDSVSLDALANNLVDIDVFKAECFDRAIFRAERLIAAISALASIPTG